MPIAIIAGMAPALARAADLSPTPLGPQIDILGVRTGQTPDQIHAILSKVDPTAQYSEGKDTDPLSDKPYVSHVTFALRKPDPNQPGKFELVDTLDVIFSAPASGNLSLSIHRDATYFGNAMPLKGQMRESLEQKYGKSPYSRVSALEPSETNVFDASGNLSGGGEPAYKQGDNCRGNPGSFSSLCGSANLYWVIFQSYGRSSDADRAGALRVELRDHALALKALKLDQAAVEQRRLRDQSNAPGAKL